MTEREQARLQIVENLLKTSSYSNAELLVSDAEMLYWWVMCDHPVSSKTDTDRDSHGEGN